MSHWNGQRVSDAINTPIRVTVRNKHCGHTFTSTSINLLTHNIVCSICGIEQRTSAINKSSKARSVIWHNTATEWQQYKANVTRLTRIAYRKNKQVINPTALPTGRAGTEGAYHVDHTVPIRYCFNKDIPYTVCADMSNLQMLGWRDNVGSKDKLKTNISIPSVFESYVTQ